MKMEFLRVLRRRAAGLGLCGLLRFGLLLAAAPALQGGEPQRSAQKLSSDLARTAEASVKDGRVAGISFVVTKGDRVIASGAAGFADLENRVPASPGTVYAIGSITKSFTAAAVLLLADEGKLSLDDPVGRFLPSFPEPGRSATIRHLLNHTAGIRSMTSLGPPPTRRSSASSGTRPSN